MRSLKDRWPVWEFADPVQITHGVLEAQWKALVFLIPSRRLLRHTLLRSSLRFDVSRSCWLGRHDRSSVDIALGQERPDYAGVLVRQGDDDQHLGLSLQHLAQPGTCWRAPNDGLFDHRAGPDGQQPSKRSLAHLGDRAELLLTAGGSLSRRQSQPGGEVPTALEGFG